MRRCLRCDESIEAAVAEEAEAAGRPGPPAMQAFRWIGSASNSFTAHPTEIQNAGPGCEVAPAGRNPCGCARNRRCPADPALLDAECVEREIASLWLTDRSRAARRRWPTRRRPGCADFGTALHATLPRLQTDMVRALARRYPGVRAPRRWLAFGSWIGGDRDGNPGVTGGGEFRSAAVAPAPRHRRAAASRPATSPGRRP